MKISGQSDGNRASRARDAFFMLAIVHLCRESHHLGGEVQICAKIARVCYGMKVKKSDSLHSSS